MFNQSSVSRLDHEEDVNDHHSLNTIPKTYSGKKSLSLEDYDPLRITVEKEIDNPPPTITINGASYATPGNVSVISGASKAGKTAISNVMLSGAISEDGDTDGFNDFAFEPNKEKRAVVHFDSEQSEADSQYNVKTILKRNALSITPPNLHYYNIRSVKINERKNVISDICEKVAEQHNGIYLILIDGCADLIKNVNDPEQSSDLVQYLTDLGINYKCPVITVLHVNPGGDKERGHVGSELQRKCSGMIIITKDGDTSTVNPKLLRKAANGDIPLIHYQYSKEKGYHVQIDAPDKEEAKASKERERLKGIAKAALPAPMALSYTDSIRSIMKQSNRMESTAKTMLKNMVGFGFIDQGVDKNYRLNIEEVSK